MIAQPPVTFTRSELTVDGIPYQCILEGSPTSNAGQLLSRPSFLSSSETFISPGYIFYPTKSTGAIPAGLTKSYPKPDALFPLPLITANTQRSAEPRPRSARKRARRREHISFIHDVNNTIIALNRIWAGIRSVSLPTPVRSQPLTRSCVDTLTSIIISYKHMRRHLSADRSESDAFNPSEHSSLGFYQETTSGPLKVDAGKVGLPGKGEGAQVMFTDHVLQHHYASEDAARRSGTLRNTPPTVAELRKFRGRAHVLTDHHPLLLQRLLDADMIVFSEHEPTVVNGYFATPKSDGKQRFVVDLRKGNLYFCRDNADLDLVNPALLAELIVEGDKLFVGQTDVSNMFHAIAIPEWMEKYFGLPPVYSDEVGLSGRRRRVWPMVKSLPMGFLGSVDIAQALRDSIVDPVLPDHVERLRNGGTTRVTTEQDIHVPYLDDDTVLSVVSAQRVNGSILLIQSALDAHGMSAKAEKTVWGGSRVITTALGIGLTEDGKALPAAKKLAKTIGATRWVLRSRRCAPDTLHSIVGQWVWYLLLNRPLMSVLSSAYEFISQPSPPREVPGPVRHELNLLLALIPMLIVDLRRAPGEIQMASDASPSGQGVVTSHLLKDEFHIARGHAFTKGWRTRHDGGDDGDSATRGSELDSRFAPVAHLVSSRKWKTVVSDRWKHRGEHITLLEARAVLTGIRWVSRQAKRRNTRVPFFIDSQAVLGAFAKGRSSSRKINRILGRTAAYICAANLRLSWLWVPTAHNPADEPSRRRTFRS